MLNYPSSTEVVRNLSQIRGHKEVVREKDGWQVMIFDKVVSESKTWVVSPKGFLWEPFDDAESAIKYLELGDYQ